MPAPRTIAQTCANVAAALKEERLRQELSLTALAERTGMSRQMMSYVERGLRIPTLDTFLRITNALKIDAAELLARTQPR